MESLIDHHPWAGQVSTSLETVLVSLAYYVCVLVTREPNFLELFYDLAAADRPPRFPLMTLLVNNLHRDGPQVPPPRSAKPQWKTMDRVLFS